LKDSLKGNNMPNYFEKVYETTLPVVVLRDTVAYPAIASTFEVADKASVSAAEVATAGSSRVFLVAESTPTVEEPKISGLYKVGCVARIKQSIRTPEGKLRILAEGQTRATVIAYKTTGDYISADLMCKTIVLDGTSDIVVDAYMREAIQALEKIHKFLPHISDEFIIAAKAIKNPSLLADFIASGILVKTSDKQRILEQFDPLELIMLLVRILEEEHELLSCEYDIHAKVQENLNRERRDYYLREQMRVIENELGEGDNETEEYQKKILKAHLPPEAEKKLLKETERLSKVPYGSAEASVLRNYLDICLELPWNKKTKERANVAAARKILNADHDGLEKVKERILEFIAVKQLTPELKSQIICLVGPPGVGKTSIAASVARATGRKYVRVALGGIRDEADIRGHRKTYVGAMPGRIITALAQVGVKNTLILLDEIDKLTADAHGDPTSALLEVLDPEQNKNFRDHFIEIPFDLSECLFITTANTLDTVPRPLIDRMEVIELNTYTPLEKFNIAKNHLIGKQLKRHGLGRRMLRITDDAIREIIASYTREAGVRNLERAIAELCRKAAKRIVTDNVTRVVIDKDDLQSYLGVPKFTSERIPPEDLVGVANGLAYTEAGGDILKIEAAVLDGTGKLDLTGSLGEVMKESAQIAVSYVRSIAKAFGIDPEFYRTKDLHIHAPEGAVPKDGPSAGVTMVTALVSALTGRPVRHDIAMTGEITLRGRMLAVGGLKEKTLAAYNAGVKKVIIPAENQRDLEEIDKTVRTSLCFIPCSDVAEVLDTALLDAPIVLPELPQPKKQDKIDIGAIAPLGPAAAYEDSSEHYGI
jgi:ATP-dependent Lon protease